MKFAFDFTSAHERQGDNADLQEAMDLYNNEQGRLAAVNYGNDPWFRVSSAYYVQNLVDTGQTLAISQDYRLVPSNQVSSLYFYETKASRAGDLVSIPHGYRAAR